MANLLITRTCNLRCSFCFANEYLDQRNLKATNIKLDQFESHLDFLDRSNINQVRLLGGEPTLHPNFPEIITRCLKRNKSIVVFSNGLIPQKALDVLEGLSEKECKLLINFNAIYSDKDMYQNRLNRLYENLSRLSNKVFLGYTISSTNFMLDDAINLIKEANLQKTLRLGIAQTPVQNKFIFMRPKDLRAVGYRIFSYITELIIDNIQVEFDCGFVRCMFTSDEIHVMKQNGILYEWSCSPVLDIDIDGKIIPCFPLAKISDIQITNNLNASIIESYFIENTKLYRLAGIFPECMSCSYRGPENCMGGCLALTIRRFKEPINSIKAPYY